MTLTGFTLELDKLSRLPSRYCQVPVRRNGTRATAPSHKVQRPRTVFTDDDDDGDSGGDDSSSSYDENDDSDDYDNNNDSHLVSFTVLMQEIELRIQQYQEAFLQYWLNCCHADFGVI